MVMIIPENERKAINGAKIKQLYDGKWIFLTNIKDNPYTAIPVVIADKPYENREKGIYKQFSEDAKYGLTGHLDLLFSASMLGFEVI